MTLCTISLSRTDSTFCWLLSEGGIVCFGGKFGDGESMRSRRWEVDEKNFRTVRSGDRVFISSVFTRHGTYISVPPTSRTRQSFGLFTCIATRHLSEILVDADFPSENLLRCVIFIEPNIVESFIPLSGSFQVGGLRVFHHGDL
jgi:hypothetical protein